MTTVPISLIMWTSNSYAWTHIDTLITRNSVQVMPDWDIVIGPVCFCMFDNVDDRFHGLLVKVLEVMLVIIICHGLFLCNTHSAKINFTSSHYKGNLQWHQLLSALEHKCTSLNCIVRRILPNIPFWSSLFNYLSPIATCIMWITNQLKQLYSMCITNHCWITHPYYKMFSILWSNTRSSQRLPICC